MDGSEVEADEAVFASNKASNFCSRDRAGTPPSPCQFGLSRPSVLGRRLSFRGVAAKLADFELRFVLLVSRLSVLCAFKAPGMRCARGTSSSELESPASSESLVSESLLSLSVPSRDAGEPARNGALLGERELERDLEGPPRLS